MCAEVQSVFADGSLSLHTRSLKYGKVTAQGLLLQVPHNLVHRRKTHFHTLPCAGASIVLALHGW